MREVERRLRAAGHSDENIRGRVFGFENNKFLIDFAVNMHKLVGTYRKMSYDKFFKWDGDGMKFDHVVGNPPYQAVTNTKTGNTQGDFWYMFLQKAINLSDEYVVFVTPRSWCGIGGMGSKRFKLSVFQKNSPIWIDFDTSRHFSVGITTCAYILKKGNLMASSVYGLEGVTQLNLRNIKVMPFIVTKDSISIANKVISVNGGNQYPFIEGNTKNVGVPKVAIIRARFVSSDKIFVDELGDTTNSWKASMPLYEGQLNGAKSVFGSKLGRCFFQIMGGPAGQSQTGILQNMPFVDLTRSWTDEEIYEHFGLTQEEIDYVEANVK